jgi:hypothetical protein
MTFELVPGELSLQAMAAKLGTWNGLVQLCLSAGPLFEATRLISCVLDDTNVSSLASGFIVSIPMYLCVLPRRRHLHLHLPSRYRLRFSPGFDSSSTTRI